MTQQQPERPAGFTVVSTRATRKRRGLETARDMVWSLAAVFAVILVILVVTWRPSPDPVRVVDWRPVAQAAQGWSWPVLVPASEPEGWRATSARNERLPDDRRSQYIGWVTADDAFVAYAQTDQAGDALTRWRDEVTAQGRPQETWTDTAGRTWQRLVNADGSQRSLIHAEGPATHIVTGTAAWSALESVVSLLRPADR